MLECNECADRVTFHAASSLDFLDQTNDKYEFIFLDCNHDGNFVYQEVPRALQHIAPGGFILLHDYFPNAQPLWSNTYYTAGVALAIQRLRNERVPIRALPLGQLPWPTKFGTSVTSLALLVADHENDRI